MSQSTASEVRDAITWKYGDKLTRISAMLTAYADMLEAQERAVPVMVVNHVSSAEHDLPIGMKLYAHPAPSDAERLAEALRGILEIGKRNMENQKYDGFFNAAREALAAHSAQAQPPAASVPTMRFFIGGPKACAYVDKFEHVEAVITALCDCTGDARDDYTSTDLLASERVR